MRVGVGRPERGVMFIEVRCPHHPKYRAAKPPIAECKWCRMIWALICEDKRVVADQEDRARRRRAAREGRKGVGHDNRLDRGVDCDGLDKSRGGVAECSGLEAARASVEGTNPADPADGERPTLAGNDPDDTSEE